MFPEPESEALPPVACSIFDRECCPLCGGKSGFTYRATIRGTQFMPWKGGENDATSWMMEAPMVHTAATIAGRSLHRTANYTDRRVPITAAARSTLTQRPSSWPYLAQ
jgi:hypothetical protein